MLKQGSCERPAEIVARRLLASGATNLQAKLGAEIASYGGECWRTASSLRDTLRRSDGRHYHRESIARARRAMAKRGWINNRRIHAAQPLPTGRASTHGTTSSHILWRTFGIKNPFARAEQRRARRAQERDERQKHDQGISLRAAIPFLESFLDETAKAPSRPESSRGTEPQRSAPTPELRADDRQAELERRAADARRRLAAWAAEHDPPD